MSNLLLLFILPFLFSLICFSLPFFSAKTLKRLAFVLSLVPLVFLVIHGTEWIGLNINNSWIAPLALRFHLRIDQLALLFIYLTAIIIPVSILSTNGKKIEAPNLFYGMIFLVEGFLFGFFAARDLLLFTIFYEAMLLPLYFLITYWGGEHRRKAALKFLIYMLAGSTLMVAAVLALFLAGDTFDMNQLSNIAGAIPYASLLFGAFLLAFAVKTPLFPFHSWLPDAYTQAPVAATILLSAILSKAGIYGMMRVGLEIFPNQLQQWNPLLLALAIIGVLYGGLAAWVQKDFKRLLAYSSFSHVNFVLAGLFVWDATAHAGAVLQALNHGITIAALFLVAGWLEQRLGTTSMAHTGGYAHFLPLLCWITLIFVLSSVALPATNNFIGELLILFGLFSHKPWLAALLGITVILSVIYMLRFMQKVYFGEPTFYQDKWVDIHYKEVLTTLPLLALIFWIGLYPMPLLEQIDRGLQNIALHTSQDRGIAS